MASFTPFQVVLLLVLYCFLVAANSVITKDDIDDDIFDTLCTINFREEAYRELDFCVEDGVPESNCSKFLCICSVIQLILEF